MNRATHNQTGTFHGIELNTRVRRTATTSRSTAAWYLYYAPIGQTSSLLEAVLFPLVEQICLGAAQVHNLWTSVALGRVKSVCDIQSVM